MNDKLVDIVSTADLRAMRLTLLERQVELAHERNMVKGRIEAVEKELRRRTTGTTDDRADWLNVGLR